MKNIIVGIAICHFMQGQCQNLDFYGLFPLLSNTQQITSKFDVNFLAASKLSGIKREIDHVYYPPKNLEIYLQTQISYKLKKHLALSSSYGVQRNNPLDANYTYEHRFAQQFLISRQRRYKIFYHRLRFEERYIQTVAFGKYSFGTRTRYQLGIMIQFNEQTYLNSSNEIFLITSGPHNSFFTENIFYVGIGRKLGKANLIESGLVYNPSVRNTAGDVRNLFLFQLLWSSSRIWAKNHHSHPLLHFRHY